MRRRWATCLLWLTPLVFGCKTATAPPDDALLINRHPIEGRVSLVSSPLIAYHEPAPPTVPWNARPRTDLANDTPTRRSHPTVEPEPRTVPGVLTNYPKAGEEPKLPDKLTA
ncbi:MAG: hypothetical protein U0744_13720 [Gemmataceae bacterium]